MVQTVIITLGILIIVGVIFYAIIYLVLKSKGEIELDLNLRKGQLNLKKRDKK